MSGRSSRGMEALIEAQSERDMALLERALLQRGMTERTARREACARCYRTPLVGERVYLPATGVILCALCQSREGDPKPRSALVHGPEFGHTLRLLDQRAA
jgi:hypothetical protein